MIYKFLSTLLLLLTFNVYAFKFSPMTMELSPKGKGKSQIVSVENNSNEAIAIQISMARREMDILGKEKQIEEEDNFLVYPSQLVLNSKEKRSIKVSWLGPAKVDKEESYRIIVEQLPIDMIKKKDRSNLKILLKYIGAVYITEKNMKSDIIVDSINYNKNTNHLTFKVINKGNKHQILKKLSVNLTGNSKDGNKKEITLSSHELDNFSGENILAKGQREFKVKLPSSMINHTYKFNANLKFE
jgi:fimbrial chaperone protein